MRIPTMPSGLQQDFKVFIEQHQQMSSVTRWSVHGIVVEWSTDHPGLEALIQELMRGFNPVHDPDSIPHVRIAIVSGTGWSIPQNAEILPPSTNEFIDTLAAYNLRTTFARSGSINYYELSPMGGAMYEIETGLALGYVTDIDSYSKWQTTHLYLLIVLLEMLRGQDLFWIHAGTVSDSGQAILFAGQTGQGKTTTVISLVEAGFAFLSEDRTFIRRLPDGVEVLTFPLDIAVTANSLDLLPSVRARIDQIPPGRRKARIDPSLLFPEAMIQRASPALILFPQVGNRQDTRLQKVEAAEALRRLLPNSLLASNPAISERHFQALSQLVQTTRSYEILLGTEMSQIPYRIRELLLAGKPI